MSRWRDSNPRPADYKSAALASELHRQHFKEQGKKKPSHFSGGQMYERNPRDACPVRKVFLPSKRQPQAWAFTTCLRSASCTSSMAASKLDACRLANKSCPGKWALTSTSLLSRLSLFSMRKNTSQCCSSLLKV